MPHTIGLIGLDTSHVIAFAKLLNNSDDPHHVPGGKVVAGYPGGSKDFDASINRVEGFTKQLRDELGVEILDTPEAVAERVDLVFITAVDGRVHRELVERVAPAGKPIFIDKPFTTSVADAEAIARIVEERKLTLVTCSTLRYADPFVEALADDSQGAVIGVDLYGPLNVQPTQGGWFFYGIHTVEIMVAALGVGCQQVQVMTTEGAEVMTCRWADGRLATVRGIRAGHHGFGGVLHREKAPRQFDVSTAKRPMYAGMLEAHLRTLPKGKSDVPLEQSLEIVRIIEAANQSRENQQPVELGAAAARA